MERGGLGSCEQGAQGAVELQSPAANTACPAQPGAVKRDALPLHQLVPFHHLQIYHSLHPHGRSTV